MKTVPLEFGIDEVMDADQCAKLLKIKKSLLYAWTSQGLIPHSKLAGGRYLRFRRSRIMEWLKRHERGGDDDTIELIVRERR
jgi:excisionase family DNA binding protein